MGNHVYDITMPSLGADMTDGTLIEWLVNIGDQVNKGDIVAVIETQKGAIDMESYQDGIVSEIVVRPVTKVPVGTVLARLATEGSVNDEDDESINVKPAAEITSEAVLETKTRVEKKISIPKNAENLASPAVRIIAQQHNLDLGKIKGSGPEGAILLRDIKSTPTPTEETKSVADAMRTAIAKAMEKSKKEIPHYYITLDIDISNVQQWLRAENATKEPEQRVLLLAVLLRAVAMTLLKFPQLNGFYLNGEHHTGSGIHIGNVISLRDGGLMVPAIHDVDRLSLIATMDALKDISDRSRVGRLRSSELTDATITITSMGERGSDNVLGIIYPPQVAIIGSGKPRKAPQVKDESIIIGERITASLSADHRVSDGIVGAKFLNALSKTLEKPEAI